MTVKRVFLRNSNFWWVIAILSMTCIVAYITRKGKNQTRSSRSRHVKIPENSDNQVPQNVRQIVESKLESYVNSLGGDEHDLFRNRQDKIKAKKPITPIEPKSKLSFLTVSYDKNKLHPPKEITVTENIIGNIVHNSMEEIGKKREKITTSAKLQSVTNRYMESMINRKYINVPTSQSAPATKSVEKMKESSKQRSDRCEGCNFITFKYSINERDICLKDGGQVDLLLMILSAVQHRARRQIIRETWASISKSNSANVRHVFLFGAVPAADLIALNFERRRYNDIIQADFVDSYLNLTRKSLMAFHWAATYCENAKFILKIDDDMWVNTPKMVDFIKTGEMRKLITDQNYGGSCYAGSLPIRNPNSKYYASVQSWPHAEYPPFCDGQTGYILTPKVASDLYYMSKNVPLFHLEDVYIGVCMKALGYKIKPINGFFKGMTINDGNLCHYKENVFTVHNVPVEQLDMIWNARCYSAGNVQGLFEHYDKT